MKRHLTSLIIRNLQNKATSRCHFSPSRLETIENVTMPVGEPWASRHAHTWQGSQDATTPRSGIWQHGTNYPCIYLLTQKSHFQKFTLKIHFQK